MLSVLRVRQQLPRSWLCWMSINEAILGIWSAQIYSRTDGGKLNRSIVGKIMQAGVIRLRSHVSYLGVVHYMMLTVAVLPQVDTKYLTTTAVELSPSSFPFLIVISSVHYIQYVHQFVLERGSVHRQ